MRRRLKTEVTFFDQLVIDLTKYIDWYIEQNILRKDGSTLSQQQQALKEKYGKTICKEEPEYPIYATYLIDIFWDLSKGRTSGLNGPNALSWLDIDAYNRLTEQQLEAFEISIIRNLDNAYLNAIEKYKEQ